MTNRRVWLATFATLALAAVLFALHLARGTPPTAVAYDGSGAVGALVIMNRNGTVNRAFCTASVVSSPAGNLILTSAHCLGRVPVSAMAFVPGYRGSSDQAPSGVWRVTAQTFPPHWFPGGNINLDFAFLTVHGDVQAKAGSEALGSSSPVPASVQVIGYTVAGDPVTCTRPPTTITAAGHRQLKFSCGGYDAEASGGPFLVNVSATTGNGTVIGVVGGYQQGGDTPAISYSSPFSADIEAVYHMALHPPPMAVPYQGHGAVGALVIMNRNGTVNRAFCTASVVSSPAGNLILTSAHCLGRVPVSAMAFVPGYRGSSDQAPSGVWRVTAQTFPPHWFPGGNINLDFAFLTVHGDVQAKAGSEALGSSSPVPASVQVIGYTVAGDPVTCTRPPTTITAAGHRQLKFSCGGYEAEASGGPFLVNVSATTGDGAIVGVIGGYQQGGDTPAVSYSSPFSAGVLALYHRLARNG